MRSSTRACANTLAAASSIPTNVITTQLSIAHCGHVYRAPSRSVWLRRADTFRCEHNTTARPNSAGCTVPSQPRLCHTFIPQTAPRLLSFSSSTVLAGPTYLLGQCLLRRFFLISSLIPLLPSPLLPSPLIPSSAPSCLSTSHTATHSRQ